MYKLITHIVTANHDSSNVASNVIETEHASMAEVNAAIVAFKKSYSSGGLDHLLVNVGVKFTYFEITKTATLVGNTPEGNS